MQAKVLDASWRELCLIMFSLLDEETRAQVLEHPDVRALQCEVDNLGTGLGAYGGCGVFAQERRNMNHREEQKKK